MLVEGLGPAEAHAEYTLKSTAALDHPLAHPQLGDLSLLHRVVNTRLWLLVRRGVSPGVEVGEG